MRQRQVVTASASAAQRSARKQGHRRGRSVFRVCSVEAMRLRICFMRGAAGTERGWATWCSGKSVRRGEDEAGACGVAGGIEMDGWMDTLGAMARRRLQW